MDAIRRLSPDPGDGGTGKGLTVLTGVYYMMMDDCADGFLKNGCDVLFPGIRRAESDPQIHYSEPAFKQAIAAGRYDIFFCINGDGLDDSGETLRELMRLKKTIVLWYVDDPSNPFAPWGVDRRVGPAAADYDRMYFFSIDEGFVQKLKARGHTKVFFLPHATRMEWAERAGGAPNPPTAPITFVGHLDMENLGRFEKFLSEYPAPAVKRVREYIEARKADYCLSWENFSAEGGGAADLPQDPYLPHIARRLATIECKIHAIGMLESAGLNVYGFDDWKRVLKNPAAYKGHVPYYAGLSAVYRQSFITLNLTHAQLSNGCNQRVLDVPACGGTLVTDSRAAIRELFPTRRPAMYRTARDLVRRVHEIIQYPERRIDGREERVRLIREKHTYERRMETLLNIVKNSM